MNLQQIVKIMTIDFILHGMNVTILKCGISDALELGSDHRAVFARFSIPNQIMGRRRNVRKKQTKWKNIEFKFQSRRHFEHKYANHLAQLI